MGYKLLYAQIRRYNENGYFYLSHFLNGGGGVLTLAHLMSFAALFVVVLAETGRIPVDNPDTHLELTMIHEGMMLEYSGKNITEWKE